MGSSGTPIRWRRAFRTLTPIQWRRGFRPCLALRRVFWILAGLGLVLGAGAALWSAGFHLLPPAVTGEGERLIEALELAPGMTVAEIGAGDGALTVEVARRLGPTSRIYSTELDRRRLQDIRRAAAAAGLSNVTVVEAAERTTNLPPGCCDAVFMRQVYHHIGARDAFNASLRETLKPRGLFAVIDFEPGGFMGRTHGTDREALVREVTAAQFDVIRTIERWGGNLYLVAFRAR